MSVCVLKLSAQVTKGRGHAALLHTILCELYYSDDPKGEHGTILPPPKYAPAIHNTYMITFRTNDLIFRKRFLKFRENKQPSITCSRMAQLKTNRKKRT